MTKKALATALYKNVVLNFRTGDITEYTQECIRKYNRLCDETPSLKNRLRFRVITNE